MVVFTCNHCGDSLQKPRVEKHYQTTCKRNFKSMTCVDCLKDFNLEEYAAHTKCITETERYAAKGTVVGVPKGEKKQESWVETVQNVIEEHKHNVKPNIKNIFDIIVKHSNIPKKKKPFINFLMNSAGRMIKTSDIEEVWNIMEKYKTEHNVQSTNLEKNDSKKSNKEENKLDTAEETAQTNGEDKKKKSKKNKNNETDGETENQTINGNVEINTEESNKSKKKRKSKDKSVEVEDVPAKKQNLEEGETPQENGKTKSKKKKRKSEKMEENKTESEESKTELEESKTKEAETSEKNNEKKSKKKKRKSEKIEENNTESEANKTELEESKTEINNEENTIKEADKRSKKKKRKLQTQEVQENNELNGIIENDEQKIEETPSKKKRKKSLQIQEKGETKQNELNGTAENDENQTEEQSAINKIIMDEFNWRLAIQEILTKKFDGIHKDKLQSKVFKKFEKEKGTIDNENKKNKIIEHYNKILKVFTNITIKNDLVKFSQFPGKYVIEKILRNEPDSIQYEELKAKVFEEYQKFYGAVIEIEKNAKFAIMLRKKLQFIRNKTINNNIIKLVA